MEDDNFSVRTPTQTEIATFQVMANLDFVDLKKPKPTSENIVPRIEEEEVLNEDEEEQPETPKILAPVLEEHVEILEDSPIITPKSTVSIKSVKSIPQIREPEVVKEPENPLYTKAKRMTEMEILTEKEGLLAELQMMEKQGIIKLSREFTIADSLEEIQFQVDRANTNYAATNAVELAKTGIRVGSKGIEIVARKFGTNALDGFSNNLCKDMNKFTRPLTKLYRKYWRRGGITSPETELAMIVLGSVAMTVVQNKDFGGIGSMVAGALGSTVPKTKAAEPPKVFDLPKFGSTFNNSSNNTLNSTSNSTSSSFNSTTANNTIPPMPTNITGKSISLKPPVIPSASWEPVTQNNPVPHETPTVPTVPSVPTKTITISTPSSSVKRNRKQHTDESSIIL